MSDGGVYRYQVPKPQGSILDPQPFGSTYVPPLSAMDVKGTLQMALKLLEDGDVEGCAKILERLEGAL